MSGSTYIFHGGSFALQTAVGPPPVYTAINGVVDVNFGSNKVDVVDTTDVGTAGTTRVYTPGLENPGECTVKINHKPGDATQTTLKAAKDSTIHVFQITYPAAGGGGTDTFSGIITGIDRSLPDDKPATLSMKIQLTGPVVSAP